MHSVISVQILFGKKQITSAPPGHLTMHGCAQMDAGNWHPDKKCKGPQK